MWTTDERDAWLGPALDDMSDEQLEAFDDAARQIFDRYPASDDNPAAGTEALSGALQVILGDDTLTNLGADRAAAQSALDRAHARLQGAILASRQLGPSEIARQSGLSRQTVHLLLNRAAK